MLGFWFLLGVPSFIRTFFGSDWYPQLLNNLGFVTLNLKNHEPWVAPSSVIYFIAVHLAQEWCSLWAEEGSNGLHHCGLLVWSRHFEPCRPGETVWHCLHHWSSVQGAGLSGPDDWHWNEHRQDELLSWFLWVPWRHHGELQVNKQLTKATVRARI